MNAGISFPTEYETQIELFDDKLNSPVVYKYTEKRIYH